MITHTYRPPARNAQRGDAGRHISKELLEAERDRDIAHLFKGRTPEAPREPLPKLEEERRWKFTNRQMMSMRAASRRGETP